jgi:hypothetical protein
LFCVTAVINVYIESKTQDYLLKIIILKFKKIAPRRIIKYLAAITLGNLGAENCSKVTVENCC